MMLSSAQKIRSSNFINILKDTTFFLLFYKIEEKTFHLVITKYKNSAGQGNKLIFYWQTNISDE